MKWAINTRSGSFNFKHSNFKLQQLYNQKFFQSMFEFSNGTSDVFKSHIKTVLNSLSFNEHEKYLKYLTSKQQQSNAETNPTEHESPNP